MKTKTANNCDFHPISICFQAGEISELFSSLMNSLGYETRVFISPEEIPTNSKIISEPIYYKKLSDFTPQNIMLVGNSEQLKNLKGVLLAQPLTEEKISTAIKTLICN